MLSKSLHQATLHVHTQKQALTARTPTAPTPLPRRGSHTCQAASNNSSSSQSSSLATQQPSDTNYSILEAFFFGRAFARTFQRRIGEAVADVVADASKAAAERPQRIREFQEEVAALARQDMMGYSIEPPPAAAPSSSSNTAQTHMMEDPEATVDELRAEIAYCRASLQQMKNESKASAAPADKETK